MCICQATNGQYLCCDEVLLDHHKEQLQSKPRPWCGLHQAMGTFLKLAAWWVSTYKTHDNTSVHLQPWCNGCSPGTTPRFWCGKDQHLSTNRPFGEIHVLGTNDNVPNAAWAAKPLIIGRQTTFGYRKQGRPYASFTWTWRWQSCTKRLLGMIINNQLCKARGTNDSEP